MELLSLPSPSTHHWLYGEHSQLPELATRGRYRERWSVRRVQALRQRIAAHKPRAVIFYRFGFRDYWAAIAGAALQPAPGDEILVHAAAGRLFVAMKHQAATGVTSDYFHVVGQYIRQS